MNKIIGSLALLWSSQLMAGSGIYLGGALGYGVFNYAPEIQFTFAPMDLHAQLDQQAATTGFLATPILGVVGQWDRFRLETEIQAFWTSVPVRLVDDGGSWTKITFDHEYVWLLRPGYQIYREVPLFIYASGGVTRAEISSEVQMDGLAAAGFGTDTVWGYKVGGGLGYLVQDHWEIRFDYLYSAYSTISNEAGADLGAPTLIPVYFDVDTSQSQYLLGLTYTW